MAIPTETSSSERLTQYARYHLAALKADPQTQHLVAPIEEAAERLWRSYLDRQGTKTKAAEARARFDRADFELDEACRLCELEVLGAAGKNREAGDYRAIFSRGLSALVAARGDTQAREVQKLVTELEQRLPDVGKKYASTLRALSERSTQAEKELDLAQDADAVAFNHERIARTDLLRQLRRNRGALRVLYPDSLRRVRSFFAQESRRPSEAEIEEPETSGEVTA